MTSSSESSSRSNESTTALASPKRQVDFTSTTSNFNPAKKYRSASRKLVEILTEMECSAMLTSRCNERFSTNNPPLMGKCGHYFCDSHRDDYVRVKCFHNRCESTERKDFINDLALEDFFNAIESSGFQCKLCRKMHPPKNVVSCSKTHDVFCVWCATSDCQLKGKDFENTPANSASPNQTLKLNSIERDRNYAGWALNTCYICWDTLYNPHVHKTTKIAPLSCGHIVHHECIRKHGIEKRKGEYTVKCKLCDMDFVMNTGNIKVRTAHTHEYLDGLDHPAHSPYADYRFRDGWYNPCEKCSQLHPHSNIKILTKLCVWCALEKKDIKRVEEAPTVKTNQYKKTEKRGKKPSKREELLNLKNTFGWKNNS